MTGSMIFNMLRRFFLLSSFSSFPISQLILAGLIFWTVCLSSILCIAASSQPRVNLFNSLVNKKLSLMPILEAKDDLTEEQFNQSLQKLLANTDLSDSQKREASYILGRSLLNSSKNEEKKQALTLFDQSQALPALSRLSRWHIVELATSLGQEKLVRHTLEQLLNESNEKEDKARIQYTLAQSYLRTNTIDQAMPLFKAIRENAKTTNYALGAAYYLGEIALSKAEASLKLAAAKTGLPTNKPNIQLKDLASYKEGIFLFCHYLQTSPTGHFAPVIIDRLTKLTSRLGPSTAPVQDALAYAYYSNGRWRQALDLWLKSKTDSGRKLEVATCLAKLGFSSQAESALVRAIQLKPDDRRYASVANMICTLLSKAEAISLWQRVLTARPKIIDVALWNIAIRAKPPRSLQCYKELLNRYPNSSYAAESQWWLFWDRCQHRHNNDSQQLIELANNSAKKYSNAKSAPRFLFWAAKLSESTGERKQAEYYYNKTAGLFPADYYGFRAAERLSYVSKKKHIYSWDVSVHHGQSTNWSWPPPSELAIRTNNLQEEPLWELLRLRQYDEALTFVQSNQAPVKAWVYAKLNQPSQAIAIANASVRGKPGRAVLWQYAFPLLYSHEIDSICKTKGNVEPDLMHALVREESYYDPRALSPAGAIGLTQLLPGTARSVATKLHVNFTSPNQLFDSSLNLELGTEHLSGLISSLQNNALFAVASYNSGSGPVTSLIAKLRAAGTTDLDIFVEDIPFAETRDYIRNVFRGYWIYASIY